MQGMQGIKIRGEIRVPRPPCSYMTELFYSPEEDGRNETQRQEREDECCDLCFTCPYRWRCLRRCLVLNERLGVWGGMGEGERRRFKRHLMEEGYGLEIPDGLEFQAALASFYTKESGIYVLAAEA